MTNRAPAGIRNCTAREKTARMCELCGAKGRELRMLAVGDFLGWACGECREQLRDSAAGIYCQSGERTEPAE